MSLQQDLQVTFFNDLETFAPYSLLHGISVGVSLACIAALCYIPLRFPATLKKVRNTWVYLLFIVQTFNVVWYPISNPGRWDILLPLQVCDLAGWIAIVALATGNPIARAALFYWGLGLSTQAFVTPTVQVGPGFLRFWLFWVTHVQIVGSAIFDLVVLKLRPTWRTYAMGLGSIVFYFLCVLPLNMHFDWNYGYVGQGRPDAPTIIDALGPWPLRLLWMFFIVSTLFAILTLPFIIMARRKRSVTDLPSPSR